MVNYYVSSIEGNDNNKGLSENTPFRTLQVAANKTKPGDTVFVMNGIYEQSKYPNSPILGIVNKKGTKELPIVFKAYEGYKPIIKSINFQAILISDSCYVIIDGFTLIGANDKITLEYAKSQQKETNNPLTNGAGISVYANSVDKISHHITIINNNISKFPGGGISTKEADYIIIENNVVSECGLYSVYGTQGISLLNLYNYDNNTTEYKNIIRGNVCYNNYNHIEWIEVGEITEGHGIMIDANKNPGLDKAEYIGKTLIINNICYNNGGAGIQVFKSSNVDVINNTTYQNSQHPVLKNCGEIFINGTSNNVNVESNILYAKPNGYSYVVSNKSTNVKADYNLIYNSTTYNKNGTNFILKDPLFVDLDKKDFKLKENSPAILKETIQEKKIVDEVQIVQETRLVDEVHKVKKLVEIEVEETVQVPKVFNVEKVVQVEKLVDVIVNKPLGAIK